MEEDWRVSKARMKKEWFERQRRGAVGNQGGVQSLVQLRGSTSSPVLRLAQWNVHCYRDAKVAKVAREAAKMGADIVVIEEGNIHTLCQDSDREQVGVWAEEGYQYSTVESTIEWLRGKASRACLNAVFSRYPFTKVEHIELSNHSAGEARYALDVTISVPGTEKKFRVAGTHLDRWDETGKVRLSEAKKLVAHLSKDPQPPAVIAADANALRRADYSDKQWAVFEAQSAGRPSPSSHVMDWLMGEGGYGDSFLSLGLPPPAETCWSSRRVDYVLLPRQDSDWVLEGTHAYCTPLSDHLAITCDFWLKN